MSPRAVRSATEMHAVELVDALAADVARLEHNYGVLEQLLKDVGTTISGLCERVNGPHDHGAIPPP